MRRQVPDSDTLNRMTLAYISSATISSISADDWQAVASRARYPVLQSSPLLPGSTVPLGLVSGWIQQEMYVN